MLAGCVPQAQPRQDYLKGLSVIGVSLRLMEKKEDFFVKTCNNSTFYFLFLHYFRAMLYLRLSSTYVPYCCETLSCLCNFFILAQKHVLDFLIKKNNN